MGYIGKEVKQSQTIELCVMPSISLANQDFGLINSKV